MSSFALAELHHVQVRAREDLERYAAAVARVLEASGSFRRHRLEDLRALELELRARWAPAPSLPRTLPPIDEMGDEP